MKQLFFIIICILGLSGNTIQAASEDRDRVGPLYQRLLYLDKLYHQAENFGKRDQLSAYAAALARTGAQLKMDDSRNPFNSFTAVAPDMRIQLAGSMSVAERIIHMNAIVTRVFFERANGIISLHFHSIFRFLAWFTSERKITPQQRDNMMCDRALAFLANQHIGAPRDAALELTDLRFSFQAIKELGPLATHAPLNPNGDWGLFAAGDVNGFAQVFLADMPAELNTLPKFFEAVASHSLYVHMAKHRWGVDGYYRRVAPSVVAEIDALVAPLQRSVVASPSDASAYPVAPSHHLNPEIYAHNLLHQHRNQKSPGYFAKWLSEDKGFMALSELDKKRVWTTLQVVMGDVAQLDVMHDLSRIQLPELLGGPPIRHIDIDAVVNFTLFEIGYEKLPETYVQALRDNPNFMVGSPAFKQKVWDSLLNRLRKPSIPLPPVLTPTSKEGKAPMPRFAAAAPLAPGGPSA